jgi:hypothetical protein
MEKDTKREKKQTDQFQAKTADGKTFDIIELTEHVYTTSLSGGTESQEGLIEYRTTDREKVKKLSDQTFEVHTGAGKKIAMRET